MIIDLDRGGLIDDLFRLPFAVAVPDLLFDRELGGRLGERLMSLGLQVEELTPSELARATVVRRQRVDLSTPDTFAFAIAEARRWTLLTGDGGLRRLAVAEGVEMHGLLWVIDLFEAEAIVGKSRLHAGLSTIFGHPRCRLPAAEVRRRLARFET